MTTLSLQQIGVIHSPWKEKFAVPRQPGLVSDGTGKLELLPPYNQEAAVRGLTDFSHIWILFIFHQIQRDGWRPTVRPPRLGGNSRTGVFATRSPFRPNPLGMSLVALKGVETCKGVVMLTLGSLDLTDGTPVVDIKPYLPFAESIPDARAGFASEAPAAAMPVYFSDCAEQQIAARQHCYPNLMRFITETLAQDPRPAYRRGAESTREYAVRLLDFTLRWRVTDTGAEVIAIDPS